VSLQFCGPILVADRRRTIYLMSKAASRAGLFPLASRGAADRHGLRRALDLHMPDAFGQNVGALVRHETATTPLGSFFPVSSKTHIKSF
jgi:hypothetical protein